jgi:DNA-binding CsgD family transcriptional regulator
MKKSELRAGTFQRNVGLLCGLLFVGFAGRSAFEIDAGQWLAAVDPLGFATLAAGFFASARFLSWRLVQPVALLAVEPIHTISGAECPCGLAASIGAAFLLYRMGYFVPGRYWKAIALLACGIVADLATYALTSRPMPAIGLFLVYSFVFSATVICMARYGDGSDIASLKPVLRLESLGLTERERRFVRTFNQGKTLKEISIEVHFSESTVRNAFSNIYRKLDIRRTEELAALGERYRIDYSGKDDWRRRRRAEATEQAGQANAATPSGTSSSTDATKAKTPPWMRVANMFSEHYKLIVGSRLDAPTIARPETPVAAPPAAPKPRTLLMRAKK